ncbi:MAG: nucleotidyltransferase domain-containing protein [Deltaproteobacteria bacterium]|nr:nucleotidyltransferase domain-containing protein [Deltaproteobacteria bacterium]
MIDLPQTTLKTIQNILKTRLPQAEVRAFGSRVMGTAKPYSDLDLVILDSQKLGLNTLATLKEAFQESNIPIRVDVLDWNAISPEFREVIEKKYEILQKSENHKKF